MDFIKRCWNGIDKGLLWIILGMIIVTVSGFRDGFESGVDSMQKQAIMMRVAKYSQDKNGTPVFNWIDVTTSTLANK